MKSLWNAYCTELNRELEDYVNLLKPYYERATVYGGQASMCPALVVSWEQEDDGVLKSDDSLLYGQLKKFRVTG